MDKENITKKVKEKLESYKNEFGVNKDTAILIIMIEILAEISLNTENIASKLWE